MLANISRILNIRLEEWHILLSFMSLTILIGLGASWGRSISLGLFISTVGSQGLPLSYILRDLGVMIFSMIYALLAIRMQSGRIAQIFSLWVVLISASVWIYFNVFGLELNAVLSYIFTVGFQIGYIMCIIHLGSYVSYHFNAVQRKRLNILIFTGLTIGSIVGGILYNVLAFLFSIPPTALLIGVTIFYAATLLAIFYIAKNFKEVTSTGIQKSKKTTQALTEVFAFFKKSTLMVYMSIAMLIFFCITSFMDYQFNFIFQKYFQEFPATLSKDEYDKITSILTFRETDDLEYFKSYYTFRYSDDSLEEIRNGSAQSGPKEASMHIALLSNSKGEYVLSKEITQEEETRLLDLLNSMGIAKANRGDLTAFFALYETIANVLAMLMMVFLTPRIITHMGVGSSNFIYPGLNVLSAIFLLFNSFFPFLSLFSGIFSKLVNAECRKSIQTPTRNLLLNGIPSNMWANVNVFFSSIASPIGTVISASLLIFVVIPSSAYYGWTLFPTLFTAGFSILFLLISFPQKKAYEDSVLQLLEKRNFDRENLSELNLGKLDDKTFSIIINQLGSGEPERVNLGLELLVTSHDARLLEFLVTNYFKVDIPIRQKYLEAIRLFETPEAYQILYRLCDQETEPSCIYTILSLIANKTETDHRKRVVPHLESDYVPLRFISREVIYRNIYSTEQDKRDVLDYINHSLDQYEPMEPILEAVRTVKHLRLHVYIHKIIDKVYTPFQTLKREALETLVELVEPTDDDVFALFIEFLDEKDRQICLLVLEGIVKSPPITSGLIINKLFKFISNRYPLHKKLVLQIFEKAQEYVKDILVGELFGYHSTAEQIINIFTLLNSTNIITEQELIQIGTHKFKMVIKMLIWMNVLDILVVKDDSSAKVFLQNVILEKYSDFLSILIQIIVVLSKKGDRTTAENIANGILSTNTNSQGNALEALSNLAERHFGNKLVDFSELNKKDTSALIAYFQKHFDPVFSQPSMMETIELWITIEDPYLTASLIYLFKELKMKKYINLIQNKNLFDHPLIMETLEHASNH